MDLRRLPLLKLPFHVQGLYKQFVKISSKLIFWNIPCILSDHRFFLILTTYLHTKHKKVNSIVNSVAHPPYYWHRLFQKHNTYPIPSKYSSTKSIQRRVCFLKEFYSLKFKS